MSKRGTGLVLIFLVACTAPSSPDPEPTPQIEVSATYSVFPPDVPFGDTPEATFRNTGNVPLEYGNDYTLEGFFGGEWVELEQPPGAEPLCVHTGEAYLLGPGSSKSQRIGVCDLYGEMHPLAPGRYRVSKTAFTVRSTPDAPTEEITEVVNFEVKPPEGKVTPPFRCHVLCLSDTNVHAGEVVTVTFDPPRRYIWGAGSELHEGTEKTATQLASVVGWQGDEELTTHWPDNPVGIEDIGFRGRGSWKWEVPARLEPGIYALVKDGIRGGVAPLPDRRRFWAVAFNVSTDD